MWAEARKQEKKIRGIMVDHKKRAERRREYYEKIRQDPAQFLQISGRSYKLHIDHNATGPEPPNTIMPWQGNADILIDRFDVRAHLDYIAEVQNDENTYPEESKEMRPLNYERYRILVQNGFLRIKEEKFLKTLALEEKYGGKTYQQQKAEDDKKKVEKNKAAIGFTYEDTETQSTQQPSVAAATNIPEAPDLNNSESDDDFDDLDTVVNFSALSRDQQDDLNSIGRSYFLGREDFIKYLQHEAEEQEYAKTAKAEEDEKSAFSGRKSRKERRILKEKRLAGRIPSPPSYAAYDSDKKRKTSLDHSTSEESSRSPSPNDRQPAGKVEYITTFGEETNKRSSKDKKSKKRSRRARSSSSSSSSDDGGRNDRGKYRSKYRRKRRSSTSSSGTENNGTAVVQPPPPPPVKRYYGRKRVDTDEEKLTEDEEPSAEFSKSECSSSQVYSREASNVSIFKTKWTLQLAVAAASESDSAIIYSKFSADPVIDKLSRIPLCYYVSFLHRFNYFYRTNLWRGE